MQNMDRRVWEQLSPLLDRVLDLEGAARDAFVRDLGATAPDLAARLVSLLDAHASAAASGFLSEGPAHPPRSADWALAGMTIGAYTLERPLGMGGMGTVWLGRRSDGQFAGTVAVKLVNLAMLDASTADRFAHEASVLARLTHPNIARLYDAGVTPLGQPYLVLEYVEGLRIDRYADEHRLDVQQRLGLFLQVADAVSHAHANLVVHRDLKPSNILVGADGRVKLLDFGIAKLVGERDSAAGATASRSAALTPEYAAPEQVSGGAITTATDVYALGVLLFQLLSAQHPTAEGAQSAVQYLRALDRPAERLTAALRRAQAKGTAAEAASARGTTPARLLRACQGDLDLITALALRQRAAERYASVLALADDIKRHLRRLPVSAQPDSVWYRARTLFARRRFETLAAVVAIAALVAGTGVALWQAQAAATERDFALRQLQRAQAMNDLNEFLLTDAAPLGRAFTAGEILGRAEAIALRQNNADLPLKIDTLITLSRQYSSQDEVEKARRLAEQAYTLAAGVDDVSLRSKAACSFAASLADTGDYQRGRTLASDALTALPDDDLHALDRVFCRMLLGHVERTGPAPALAVDQLRRAHSEMFATGLGSPLLHISVMMQLAESLRVAGRPAEAADEFAQAYDVLVSVGRDQTETAGTLLNNWGLAALTLGRPREAESRFRRAVEIASADGTEASVSPMLLTNLARPLVDLGRFREAAELADRAAALASDSGYVVVYNQALLLRAAAYRQLGDFTRAEQLLDEFAARAARDVPPGHVAHDILVIDRGRLAAARGDVAAAATAFDHAIARLDVPSADRQIVLQRALQARAALRLSQGDAAGALIDSDRLVAALRTTASDSTMSFLRGRAASLRGQSLARLGRLDEARAELDSARRHLAATVGLDHYETTATVAAFEAIDRRR